MSSESGTNQRVRSTLTAEAQSLRRQLGELGFGDAGSGAGLDYDANFADSSQVTAEKSEAASIATSLREALDDVDHALLKLDGDSFGVCEDRGETIPADRIDAMPTSRYCIDCVSKRR